MTSHSRFVWHKVGRLVLAVAAFGLPGCSQSPGSPLQQEQHVLSSTYQVTIATPNGVSPTAPVLIGSSSVRVGARAEIVSGVTAAMGTGGLQAEPDAILNETWSRGTAVLRDRVRIRGTLHARTRTLGNSVTVPTWDSRPAFDPVSTLSWEVKWPAESAGNFTLNSGQAGGLAAGRHGHVTLNSQTTLNLESGTYYFTSFTVQTGAVVNVHAANGPVVVYVADALTWRGSFQTASGPARHLLFAYLGTAPVVAETRFDGALIAPSATLTLRSVSGAHTGYFQAKDLVIDSNARVAGSPPVALVSAVKPPGEQCRALLAGQVPDEELFRYCPCSPIPTDSDGDGVEDCVDGCDFDPNKTERGRCDCGTADTDYDGDGTPDCHDLCDRDPKNTSPGQCGCVSSKPDIRAPLPAGTPCTDTACPQGAATCDGEGVCGSRTPCLPNASCQLVQYERSTYWVCPGPSSRAAALQACAAKQMTLARIDGFSENLFIRKQITKPMWIGANSITTSGNWRWSVPGSNDDQFWAGGVTGSQRNYLYSSWKEGSPATGRCAVIEPGTGNWVSVDCEQALGYVCEFVAPIVTGPILEPAGGPDPGLVTTTCTPESSSHLPGENALDQLYRDQALANMGHFQGAAANHPLRGTLNCENPIGANAIGLGDEGEGCEFTPSTAPTDDFTCIVDADCASFGAGLRCRQVKDDPDCEPAPGAPCHGIPICGTLTCPPPPDGTDTCDMIQVCSPGTDFIPTTGGDLDSTLFNPGTLFDTGAVPTPSKAENYVDPPVGSGKDHSWCFMSPQQEIPDAVQSQKDQAKNVGQGTPITFSFHPDAEFNANVNPLALGESDFGLLARAELEARVHLNDFLGVNINEPILSAIAEAKAERCSIGVNTELTAFGIDFVSLAKLPEFTTRARWPNETAACDRAVGTFVKAANRAKKAFRDAEQLLDWYRTASSTPGNLCEDLMALAGPNLNVADFPDGLDCPANEPAEITINRFIDYYQAPYSGQVSRLRDAVQALEKINQFLRDKLTQRIDFGPKPKGESVTLARGHFQLGPVPMVLEIEAFYSYGIAGHFDFGLNFPYNPFSDLSGQLGEETVQRDEIAHVRAGVMPYATAGLTAFVGAGANLGPLSASVGIEGSVTLGSVQAPIFVGAGLGAEIREDKRELPESLKLLGGLAGAGVTHLGVPKSAKFFVWFNYGAALEANNVLDGEINGRLRVKFAFFSRTWRKRIIKFTGIRQLRIDIVSGTVGNDPGVSKRDGVVDYRTRTGQPAQIKTNVVEGTTDVGYSEAQVPLLVLSPLEPPATPLPPGDNPPLPSHIGSMFYDDLCCAKVNEACLQPHERAVRGGPAPCCPGLDCGMNSDGGFGCFECGEEGVACTYDDQCCSTIDDRRGICGPEGACRACLTPDDTRSAGLRCDSDDDCCGSELGEMGCVGQGFCAPLGL
jgi:hypothetical protein